jgi:hypothetical protein
MHPQVPQASTPQPPEQTLNYLHIKTNEIGLLSALTRAGAGMAGWYR